jgi:cell wall-associated NlpC family hydrolase
VADRSYRPARILLILGTAAAATLITGTAVQAEPQPTLPQVEQRVAALYQTAEQATERYNEARLALADAERKLTQAQRRVASQQADLVQKQRTIGVLAASAYRAGGIDPQLNLLFADDPAQFLERASALDMLSHRQAAAVRQAQHARQELRADSVDAAQQYAAVERWRQTVATHKAAIERDLRAAQEQLNSLRAEQRRLLAQRAAAQRRLAELAAERERAAEQRRAAAAEQQRAAGQRSTRSTRQASTPARTTSNPPPVSGRAGTAVQFAYAQLGDRYVYGGTGPNGWDCSGLTMMAWRAAGVALPHSARGQYARGTRVSRSQLKPGDLVFFYSPIHHVGIAIGGGRIIHAPNPSRRVEIAPISWMPFAGATRL